MTATTSRTPVVSIISPCLNGFLYLPQMVASVRSQTLPDWELIYVDDGSADGSLAYMTSVAGEDPRVRVCQTAGRQGASAARNTGVAQARGQFIAFLDCDDWWLPEKLQRQAERMREQGAAFSCTAYHVCHEDGQIFRTQEVFGPLTSRRHLRKQAVIGCLTVMYDRTLLETVQFRTQLSGAEDYVLWYEMLLEVERRRLLTTFLPQPLACYRVHDAGKSRNKRHHARAHWRAYRRVLGFSVLQSVSHFASYVANALYDRRPQWMRGHR